MKHRAQATNRKVESEIPITGSTLGGIVLTRRAKNREVMCRVCRSKSCAYCGPPLHLKPPRVAGVPIVVEDLSLGHYRCRNCSYRFVYPAIPEDRLLECYANSTSKNWTTDGAVAESRSYSLKRDLLLRFAKNGRNVLDFGCFDGGFLSYLDDDWIKYGIEPATEAACISEKRGIRIAGSTLSSLNRDELPEFDAIIVFDVMEHLSEPVSVLSGLAALLKKGGIMLIETGNTDSLHFRISGRAYSYCRPVEHVGFFNRTSITAAGRAAGLEVEHFQESVHSQHRVRAAEYAKDCLWVFFYYMLRMWHTAHLPLPSPQADLASGAEPRSLYIRDHFLAVLRKQ